MSRFDLLHEENFINTSSVLVVHNLERYVFNVRLIESGDPRFSRRELMQDIELVPTDPLNKCVLHLTTETSGVVQIIAEDTTQSPYYTVDEKLAAQLQTDLAGTSSELASYTGNANVGRYLEYVPGSSSDSDPFLVVGDGKIRAMAAGASANTNGAIQLVKLGTPETVLYTLNYGGTQRAIATDLNIDIFQNDEICWRVSGASVNTPYCATYFQTI